MTTWLIVVAGVGGLVALLVWALCRVSGRTTREMERQAATWPLVCVGSYQPSAVGLQPVNRTGTGTGGVPPEPVPGPDCRGQWHGEAICTRPGGMKGVTMAERLVFLTDGLELGGLMVGLVNLPERVRRVLLSQFIGIVEQAERELAQAAADKDRQAVDLDETDVTTLRV